ncbi:Hypothetical Protein FCC1311_015422 [Hondaea fermentalgiana]|uniref:Cilia- and flagella-associated protein 36 n=1 Tax=Hondaea fermentalgiana TaxID=2315210 RepID=A0A2R5GC54_9STRA|nr:Hypothetical Protein FCC1311_015422 [Hondaea fermentalgiana]|eukprot:GBG25324.1 Hypothetical Protein FCC1311_015422 [Hondaea fermentalgiana]
MESKFAANEEKFEDGTRVESKHCEQSNAGKRVGKADLGEDETWVLPGTGEESSVLARAAEWFGREKKKGKLKLLSEFAEDNYHVFEEEATNQGASEDGTGYRLEYDECHKRFLGLFEEQLECFIEEEGFRMEDFEKDCEDVRNGKSLTLFEHEDHSWFLEALLSTLDYTHFHKTMVNTAKKHLFSGRQSKTKK